MLVIVSNIRILLYSILSSWDVGWVCFALGGYGECATLKSIEASTFLFSFSLNSLTSLIFPQETSPSSYFPFSWFPSSVGQRGASDTTVQIRVCVCPPPAQATFDLYPISISSP